MADSFVLSAGVALVGELLDEGGLGDLTLGDLVGAASLDIPLPYPLSLERVIEKIAEDRGGKEGLGSGPAGDVEGAAWVSAGRVGTCDMVRTEGVQNDATT